MTRAVHFVLGSFLSLGCLPVDARPPPGHARVTVSSDDTSGGIPTDDGWLVTYERALISAGNFGVAEGPCEQYAESHYVRVLDLLRPEPQKLVDAYALGTCPFIVEVRAPPDDAVLGAGVDAETRAFMQERARDPFVPGLRGVALHFAGRAVSGDRTVRFAWSIREQLAYGTGSCGELAFVSGTTKELALHFRTAELFVDPALNGGSQGSHFEPFAAADADGDAVITLEELDAVPFDGGERFPSLGARFYRKTASELLSVDGVVCEAGRFIED